MRGPAALILVTFQVYFSSGAPRTRPPEENIRLLEGDIINVQMHNHRNLVLDPGRLWPNKTIFYELSDEYHEKEKMWIQGAVAALERKTCVRFKVRKDEKDYLVVRNKMGCASPVGFYPAGKLEMFLLLPHCIKWGTIQHEFLHSLGFWHEHTRPDRDEYVDVQWDNVLAGAEDNFLARGKSEAQMENMPYDYGSVMHYRDAAFAKDTNSPTLVPLAKGVKIGQRTQVSKIDVAKLNRLYECGPEYYLGDELVQEYAPSSTTENSASSEEIFKESKIVVEVNK